MSKPDTGQNVEDMLSSVRRLVSDELPRMPRADVPKGPAALVLTEAQRIEPPMTGHNSRRKSLEDRIAELEAAVADSSDEYEPDGSEDLEQHRPDTMVFRPSRPGKRPTARPLHLSEILRAEAAERGKKDPEPSDSIDEKLVDEPPEELDGETEEELHEQVETALTEAVTTAIVEMTEDALQGDEAFEQALADAVGAEPEVAEEALEDAEPEKAVSETLDATEMRDLISSLIREELQGELGERITRNVRKLVRQEIQRALTVREVE
ncbi:MAG: hypothetical protein KJN60_00135 [Boseongicola sp.]|nr:hypothetical protein [Altererythrobacter sp.]MBT8458060.1 hypothetical protein [Boseongicola sp.]